MKKFLKAWRKARVYNNNFGGAYVFWDFTRGTWMAVPNAKKPGGYEYQWKISNPEPFWNYMTKQ
jgi:hypothetical protein